MKVQITVSDELLAKVDKYTNEHYMSRSGLFSLAMAQYLNAYELTEVVKNMASCMRTIADNNTVSEETLSKLEELEKVAQLLTGNG